MSFDSELNVALEKVFGTHLSGDRKVWFHWQNLNEKRVAGEVRTGSPIRHGRCWLHFVPDSERRGKCLRFEWLLGDISCCAGVSFDPNDHEILVYGGLPGVKLYAGLEGIRWPWLWRKCDNGRGYGDPHNIGFRIFDWTFWWEFWANEMSYSPREEKWWTRFTFHFDHFLLGHWDYRNEKHGDPMRLWIPLPEGEYLAEAQYETSTWRRPRWPWWPFKKVRQDTKVEVLAWTGLPHEGKGENSWDCGTDGLYGYSSEGHNLTAAIAKGVESTLRDRRKYGGSKPGSYPSPVVDHELGLRRFAEYAARLTKIHQQHPKWPVITCHQEPIHLGRVIITVNRGEGHRSCMVVTEPLAAKWADFYDEAMRTVMVEEGNAAQTT